MVGGGGEKGEAACAHHGSSRFSAAAALLQLAGEPPRRSSTSAGHSSGSARRLAAVNRSQRLTSSAWSGNGECLSAMRCNPSPLLHSQSPLSQLCRHMSQTSHLQIPGDAQHVQQCVVIHDCRARQVESDPAWINLAWERDRGGGHMM